VPATRILSKYHGRLFSLFDGQGCAPITVGDGTITHIQQIMLTDICLTASGEIGWWHVTATKRGQSIKAARICSRICGGTSGELSCWHALRLRRRASQAVLHVRHSSK